MTTNPEEHDFIKQVCAEDDAARVPPRLSDDPAVRLAECREDSLEEDGFRTVPLSILAAACHAIQNQKEAPKLLAHIRRYTLGDLAKPAFDEAAERVKFEALCESKGLEYDRYTEYAGEYAGQYTISRREHEWQGWLACAKSRAEVK